MCRKDVAIVGKHTNITRQPVKIKNGSGSRAEPSEIPYAGRVKPIMYFKKNKLGSVSRRVQKVIKLTVERGRG